MNSELLEALNVLEKEKNIVDNMHSAVCWNVAFVERLYQGDVGIVIQNTKKLYGIVEGI